MYFENANIKINFIRERKRHPIAANLCKYIWAYLSLQGDILIYQLNISKILNAFASENTSSIAVWW